MLNAPTPDVLAAIPGLYRTEETPIAQKTIHLHFFISACHWFAAEFDGNDLFFGYATLGDAINAEWGYFSLKELRETRMMAPILDMETGETITHVPVPIECDRRWTPRQFCEIEQEEC